MGDTKVMQLLIILLAILVLSYLLEAFAMHFIMKPILHLTAITFVIWHSLIEKGKENNNE